MFPRKLSQTAVFSTCLLAGYVGTFGGNGHSSQPNDMIALQDLQSAFHGSGAYGDVDLMASIWAEDAVFSGGGNVVKGRDKIVDFFKGDPNWGKTANLAPTYKSTYDIRGNKATIRFECVIVKVDGSSPVTTPLSTLPPGAQNPKVEIIQHSNTTIEAVKQRGQWVIQTFTGKGGAI